MNICYLISGLVPISNDWFSANQQWIGIPLIFQSQLINIYISHWDFNLLMGYNGIYSCNGISLGY